MNDFCSFRVGAIDPDSDADLRYSIDPERCEGRNEFGRVIDTDDYDFVDAFDIGEMDGVVRLGSSLDRERVEVITLGLVVEDVASINGPQIDRSEFSANSEWIFDILLIFHSVRKICYRV